MLPFAQISTSDTSTRQVAGRRLKIRRFRNLVSFRRDSLERNRRRETCILYVMLSPSEIITRVVAPKGGVPGEVVLEPRSIPQADPATEDVSSPAVSSTRLVAVRPSPWSQTCAGSAPGDRARENRAAKSPTKCRMRLPRHALLDVSWRSSDRKLILQSILVKPRSGPTRFGQGAARSRRLSSTGPTSVRSSRRRPQSRPNR